jgi:hypothetical protein
MSGSKFYLLSASSHGMQSNLPSGIFVNLSVKTASPHFEHRFTSKLVAPFFTSF